MAKAVTEIAAGAGLIVLDILTLGASIPAHAAIQAALIGAGASLTMAGVGTLLTKQMTGLSASVRNPIQPWNVVYGQARVGGDIVFLLETGQSDKFLHTVYVLACHPSQSVDAILFDDKRIPLDTSGNSISFGDSTSVIGSQQTVNIASITRVGDVVTVEMASPMPLYASSAAGPALATGDTVQIQNVTADQTLNGLYQIQLLSDTSFTYICGGSPVSITAQGQVQTTWPDYGDTVHVEIALGNQTSNPFPGLEATDDTGSNGLWTSQHILQGRTAVYVRLKYGGDTYASGSPPNTGFVVSGKNDIYDPRTATTGYTTNAALCTADYLAQPVWGFKAAYGSEIPAGALIAAANICDEAVALASGGTEARYTCNGSFALSAKRGEILQNLLSACGGRLTYVGGQFVINPAAWVGTAIQIGSSALANGSNSAATAGTLTVWSEFIDTQSAGVASAGISVGNITSTGNPWGVSGTGTVVRTNTPYARRSDTLTLSPSALTTSLTVNCFIFPDLATPPGGAATYSPAPTLRIYDVYMDMTYADGSSARLRPKANGMLNFGGGNPSFGSVTNPADGFDADSTPPVTYANYQRAFFNQNYFSNSPPNVLTYSRWDSGSVLTPEVVGTGLTFAAGPFQWKPKLASRDLFNGIKATYISQANNWQASDMPPYAQDELHGYVSDANLASDGERRWLDLQLPFTKSVATAQRLSKIELLRRRQQGAGTFVYNLAMYQVTALDVIAMDLPLLGWSGKLLEITAHRFTVAKQEGEKGGSAGMVLGTEIDVQETDPSVYDWSASEELSAQGYAQASVGPQTVAAPSGATATSGSGVAADVGGLQQSRVQISWTAPTDGYVVQGGSTIVQYQVTGSSTWTALGNYDPSTTSAYINGVSDGTSYTARIAYMSAQGIQSPWTVLSPVTASGSTGMHIVDDEVPAGTMNGVNPTFTLANIPNPASSLALYLNEGKLRVTIDYTLSGSTITLLTVFPNAANGDSLTASYRY